MLIRAQSILRAPLAFRLAICTPTALAYGLRMCVLKVRQQQLIYRIIIESIYQCKEHSTHTRSQQ